MRGFWAKLGLIASIASLVATAAFAQGGVQQAGAVTTSHVAGWLQSGVVIDGGGSGSPFVSAVALFDGPECPLTISSQTGPGSSTSPLGQFSICQTAAATTLFVQGFNGSPTPALDFDIGGSVYPFAGGAPPTLAGTCTTGSQVGGNTAGSFAATCSSQTVVMTFATAAPNGWACFAQDQTVTSDSLKQSGNSTSTCTLTGTTGSGNTVVFTATAF